MEKGFDSYNDSGSEEDVGTSAQYSQLQTAIDRSDLITVKNFSHISSSILLDSLPILHYAIKKNKLDIVHFLIESGCDVNAPNSHSQISLHVAAEVGNINIVSLCIKHGAKIEARDKKGMTPVHYAALSGHALVLSYLFVQKANLDVRDNKGRTPLMLACIGDHSIAVRWLLKHHARILDQDSAGRTVLHWAATSGAHRVTKVILDSRYGPQLMRTVDFSVRTPIETMKEPMQNTFGLTQTNFQKTYRFLSMYQKQRVWYEFQDFIDHYLAFLLIPALTIIGLFAMAEIGLFSSPIFHPFSHWLSLLFISIITLWVYLCIADPGRVVDSRGNLINLPLTNIDLHQAYNEVMRGEKQAVGSMCPTCEIERIDRCKHCSKCDVCIIRIDHHCRWLNNCIGYKNHRAFFIFLTLCITAVFLLFYVLYLMSYHHLFQCPDDRVRCFFYVVGIVMFFFNLSWMGSYCVYLWVLQFLQISRNITTNETINWRHYSYLQDGNGKFRNPYDRGFFRNWLEFWGIVGNRGYNVVLTRDVYFVCYKSL